MDVPRENFAAAGLLFYLPIDKQPKTCYRSSWHMHSTSALLPRNTRPLPLFDLLPGLETHIFRNLPASNR